MPAITTGKEYSHSSFARVSNQYGASCAGKYDVFFDAVEELNVDEEWFDARDELYDAGSLTSENILAGEYADSHVPVTEDLLRCVKQIVRMLGEAKKTDLLSQLLAKIFPVVPFSIITAVNSLCTAIRENKQIDIAVLNTLSLASWCLPDDMNLISRLAVFIRETLIGWTGASFLREAPGEDDGHQEHLYMALAVAAVVGSHFISGADAPQRALFRVPAFAANLLLRGHMYWKALGAMVYSVTPPEEPAHRPAFEVESGIATTVRDAGTAQKGYVINFSSNSTVDPEACTRATVENRTPLKPEVAHSLAEKAHAMAMARLMRESKLSGLQNCITRQTVTRELRRGEEIAHTYLNTQCDATAYPDPLPIPIPVPVSQPWADDPPPANSAAAELPYGYTTIAMATAGVAVAYGNPWTLALKSNVVRSAGAVTVLGALDLGGIALRNRFVGKKVAPSVDAHRVGKHRHRKKYKKINKMLARIMRLDGILDKTKRPASFKKEEIIAAVGIMIFAPNPESTYDVTRFDKRLEEAAKMILKAKNPAGWWADEKISAGRAGMEVQNWLFDNVLGMPVESWLARNVATFKPPAEVNALLMQRWLRFDALRSAGIINTEGLSDGKKWQFEKLWNYALDNTLPFTNWGVSSGVTDDDFLWLHTGSLLLKDAGKTQRDFSVEECQTLGKALWQRVESGDMDIKYLKYLTLPALLFEAVNHPKRVSHRKKNTFSQRLRAVSQHAEYRSTVAQVYANLRAKVEVFNKASKDWTPRGDIADKYVDKCPDNALIQLGRAVNPGYVLGGRVAAGRKVEDPAELIKLGKACARQSYLNNVTPRGCSDVSVTAEYERKTLLLANAFSTVDKYMLAVAMGGLEKKELNFINSGRAAIWQIAPSVRPPFTGRPGRPEPKNKNLFLVRVGVAERIYAFVRNEDGEYAIKRLDRKIDNYFRYNIFDTPGDASRQVYKLDLPGYVSVIDPGKNAVDGVVTHFATVHGSELYSQLSLSGYDMTLEQKAIEFLKDLIPFYGCFNGNIISCLIDVVSFIPVAGQAASLAGRFGLSLSRAIKLGIKLLPSAALSTNIVKAAGRQALAQISLPTISELASLSNAAIRALDPGFELLTAVGKYSGAGLKSLFNKLQVGMNADDAIKLNRIMSKALEKIEKPGEIEQAISHEELPTETANLPGTKIQVPVIAVGQTHGKQYYYYSIVDPETMEPLEEIYVIKEGELELVHQSPHNRSPKYDINDQKSTSVQNGEKKVDPVVQPSKEEVVDSLCPTGTRVKRSFEDLCAAQPFKNKGKKMPFTMAFEGEILPLTYKMPLLKKVNPVRYEILQESLGNIVKIGLEAGAKLKGMDLTALKNSFQFHTNIKIPSDNQAILLRGNIKRAIDSCNFFWAADNTHILLSSFPTLSKETQETVAIFLSNQQAMLITDSAFDRKSQALLELTIMHESSHVDSCQDNFYYPDYPYANSHSLPLIEASKKAGVDVISYYVQYLKDIYKKCSFDCMTVGDDLKAKLGIDKDLTLKGSDPLITKGMEEREITPADLMIENADTIAFYILCIGHNPMKNNWRDLNDLFHKAESGISFSDSVDKIESQG